MLVELRAIACDDNELPNHLRWAVGPFRRIPAPRMTRRRGLRQEPRERGPRCAPAGWARRGANFKTLVAIETQGELSQREVHLRSKHASTADHRRVTSGTGTGPSEPVVATVTSVRLRAAGPVYGMPHPQSPHELVERALATAITGEPDAPQDFDPEGPDPRAATARPEARASPWSTGVRGRAVAEQMSPH
jgi:hypothetical protein